MQILLATAVIVLIMVVVRVLHRLLLQVFVDAVQPVTIRSHDRIVRQAVAHLDREYEDLVRRFR